MRQKRAARLSAKGYSLMEVLSVALIVAAVAAVLFPDSGEFFAMQKCAAQASILVSDIRLARSWSMVNQTYTRMIFSDDYTSWVVQEHTLTDGTPVVGLPTTPSDSVHQTYDENSTTWRSILDESARFLSDGNTRVTVSPNSPPKIFFAPEGVLCSKPSISEPPIGCIKVQFNTGEVATMDVDISPAGALESTEFYSEFY
jgi:Tfp pilus assembly protein FimT